MFAQLFLAALLAVAGVNAAPAPNPSFGISLVAEGYPVLPLRSHQTGVNQSQLVFERPSAYTPSPAFISESYLNIDAEEDSIYSVYFDEVGDNYGAKTPVLAKSGINLGRTGFAATYPNGSVTARLEAALEHFFACNTTIDGESYLGLFWGVYDSSSDEGLVPPADCVAAELVTSEPIYQ